MNVLWIYAGGRRKYLKGNFRAGTDMWVEDVWEANRYTLEAAREEQANLSRYTGHIEIAAAPVR